MSPVNEVLHLIGCVRDVGGCRLHSIRDWKTIRRQFSSLHHKDGRCRNPTGIPSRSIRLRSAFCLDRVSKRRRGVATGAQGGTRDSNAAKFINNSIIFYQMKKRTRAGHTYWPPLKMLKTTMSLLIYVG